MSLGTIGIQTWAPKQKGHIFGIFGAPAWRTRIVRCLGGMSGGGAAWMIRTVPQTTGGFAGKGHGRPTYLALSYSLVTASAPLWLKQCQGEKRSRDLTPRPTSQEAPRLVSLRVWTCANEVPLASVCGTHHLSLHKRTGYGAHRQPSSGATAGAQVRFFELGGCEGPYNVTHSFSYAARFLVLQLLISLRSIQRQGLPLATRATAALAFVAVARDCVSAGRGGRGAERGGGGAGRGSV